MRREQLREMFGVANGDKIFTREELLSSGSYVPYLGGNPYTTLKGNSSILGVANCWAEHGKMAYKVGERYHNAYWHEDYTVLACDGHMVEVEWSDGHKGKHCTPLDRWDFRYLIMQGSEVTK